MEIDMVAGYGAPRHPASHCPLQEATNGAAITKGSRVNSVQKTAGFAF